MDVSELHAGDIFVPLVGTDAARHAIFTLIIKASSNTYGIITLSPDGRLTSIPDVAERVNQYFSRTVFLQEHWTKVT